MSLATAEDRVASARTKHVGRKNPAAPRDWFGGSLSAVFCPIMWAIVLA
jgi:hypothetical protein